MKNLILFILVFQNYNCKSVATSSAINSDSLINSETKIRYIERYGSICCPRDYKYDNHLIKYIKAFENEHSVILESNFKLPLGKEGEAAFFLSLENISSELQENFIKRRLEILKTNDKSIFNHQEKPILIKQALNPWANKSITNLIKI